MDRDRRLKRIKEKDKKNTKKKKMIEEKGKKANHRIFTHCRSVNERKIERKKPDKKEDKKREK